MCVVPVRACDFAQPYPQEAIEERNRLLQEGFPDWKRQHFYGYLGAIRRYGRTDLAGVQQVMGEMGKDPEDVARYHEVFWRRGPLVFEKWTTMIDAVKRAENRAREIAKLERAVAAKVSRCTRNPWDSEELVAGGRKLGKSQGIRTFTPEDDRALLCLVSCRSTAAALVCAVVCGCVGVGVALTC